jgi:hypothetical protein
MLSTGTYHSDGWKIKIELITKNNNYGRKTARPDCTQMKLNISKSLSIEHELIKIKNKKNNYRTKMV